MSGRFMTLHPDEGKQGVNIERAKYDQVHAAIVLALREQGPLTFNELTIAVTGYLRECFEGSVPWYVVTVKLDMEARRQIKRVSGTRPEKMELMNACCART